MLEKTRLDLGIGGGNSPGKTLLVKSTSAADYAVLRDVYGFGMDPLTKDVLIFPTIDSAIGACRASLGDKIYVAPGHTETLATAGAITLDVAGVEIIGLGVGANRPVLTFSATGSTFLMTANNCKLKNIIGTPSVDSVVAPFIVSGNDCEIDIEWKDASAAVEAVRAIRLDTADNAICKLVYKGFTAGNAVVNGVTIDDCDNVKVEIDAYGIVTTAWVNMVDALSTNVSVRGRMYTQGITNYSRDVVDTITNSKWDAMIYDSSAGLSVEGGSASALAASDSAAIAASVTTLQASVDTLDDIIDTEFPVVATAVGAVADAAVTTVAANKSLMAYVKGILNTEYALPQCVEKSDGAVLAAGDPIFDITGGPILCLSIVGIVTTGLEAAPSVCSLQYTTVTPAATVEMSAAPVEVNGDVAGTSYQHINTTAILTPVTAGIVMMGNAFATEETKFLLPIGTMTFDAAANLTGVIKWYLRYVPMSPLSRVVAAA